MTTDTGRPPRTGWAKLVTELLVRDIAVSTAFWRAGSASRSRTSGRRSASYGRGVMFQVQVAGIEPILAP